MEGRAQTSVRVTGSAEPPPEGRRERVARSSTRLAAPPLHLHSRGAADRARRHSVRVDSPIGQHRRQRRMCRAAGGAATCCPTCGGWVCAHVPGRPRQPRRSAAPAGVERRAPHAPACAASGSMRLPLLPLIVLVLARPAAGEHSRVSDHDPRPPDPARSIHLEGDNFDRVA